MAITCRTGSLCERYLEVSRDSSQNSSSVDPSLPPAWLLCDIFVLPFMSSAVQVARLTLPSELNSHERFVNTSGGELGQGNICMLGGLVSRCRRNRQIISAIGSASGRMVVRSTPWGEI